MTKVAAMPIYGKNLKKSSSPEPIDRWPWNLVGSIMYTSTTKIIQIITLGWRWLILCQGQRTRVDKGCFWPHVQN